eukprot:13293340-Alexandrium_andersonii.AAC.1
MTWKRTTSSTSTRPRRRRQPRRLPLPRPQLRPRGDSQPSLSKTGATSAPCLNLPRAKSAAERPAEAMGETAEHVELEGEAVRLSDLGGGGDCGYRAIAAVRAMPEEPRKGGGSAATRGAVERLSTGAPFARSVASTRLMGPAVSGA